MNITISDIRTLIEKAVEQGAAHISPSGTVTGGQIALLEDSGNIEWDKNYVTQILFTSYNVESVDELSDADIENILENSDFENVFNA